MKGPMLLLLLLALGLPGRAQSGNEGSLAGTITDPSGAVVPGVTLTCRNVNTGAALTVHTESRGFFHFLVLPVGPYELVAEHPGFAKLVRKELMVTVGARINLTLSLKIAAQAELVEVNEETPLLESTRSQVSSTLNQRLVAGLPVNGRNFLDFVALTPGVARNPLRGGPSFGGQRGGNSFLVDGADNTDGFFGSPLGASPAPYQFSQEAVQEFQVNTNAYSAEFGRAGAGVINVVTKSGANDFHGSLFWYFRDRALNATDLISKTIGEPKQALHVHQFGGAAGGPILRNKLFFFGSYDGQRRAEQNLTFLNLPSGFRLSPDSTVAAFQQQALDYLTPRAASSVRGFDQNVYLAKLDWQVTATQLLSGRLNRQRFAGRNLEGATAVLNNAILLAPQISLERMGELAQHTDTLALAVTSTFSSSVVNVARFNHVRSKETGRPNSSNPEASVLEGGQLVLAIGRVPTAPREVSIRQSEWSNTLSFSRGSHAIKVGGNVLVDRIRFFTSTNFSGSFRFNSLESFGRNLAGAAAPVNGETFIQAFSGHGTLGVSVEPSFTEFGGFIQDEWRARRSLTFNWGLRYEVQILAQPGVTNPAPALAAAGLDTSHIPGDKNNFAPRFGFAWSPLESARLVVRGGYGLFYPRSTAGLASRAHFLNGVTLQTRTFSGAAIPLYPNSLCGAPDSSGTPPTCPPPTIGSDIIMPFSPDHRQPLTQQGNFGFEYQLQKDLAASVTYLTVKGTHLERYRDVNLNAPIPATIGIAGTSTLLTFQRFTLPRPIAGFDRILLLESNANSIYHGMAVQLNKRFSNNFQFLAAYTLSKVIDDNPDPAPLHPGEGDSRLISDSSNPRWDRGPGLTDQRHCFALSGIWELNYAKRMPALAKAILQDWEVSGILAAQSGQPYSGRVNFDLNNDGNAATDRTPGLGRNTFYRPATVSLDPRLTRNIRFTESIRMQVIWEAFNVFNHGNVSNVRTAQFSRSTSLAVCGTAGTPCLVPQTTGTTAFGTPTATFGPRIMQFSLKLLF